MSGHVYDELKRLGLVTPGRLGAKNKQNFDALRLCHAGRLVDGLSISLHATADEVVGPLTHALGGAARQLRLADVRTGPPLVLEIEALGLAPASEEVLREKWEVEDVRALIHNLNDLYRADPGVKAAAVLGEFEDMLHVWCINKATLPTLLDRGFLGRADNLPTLRVIADVSS